MKWLCIYLLLVPGLIQAQSNTNRIKGLVKDSANGEWLPFVQLGLIDSSGMIIQVSETDFDGFFKMENISAGPYKLIVYMTGYFKDTFRVYKNINKQLELGIYLAPLPGKGVVVKNDGSALSHHGKIIVKGEDLTGEEKNILKGAILMPPGQGCSDDKKIQVTEENLIKKLSKREKRRLEKIRRKSTAIPRKK